MSADPNFIQKLEAQAETFFEHMKEQIEEATHDAAPSSTEPVPNAPAVAGESATAPAIASEVPNADAPTQPAGDAMPAAGEDPNAAVSVAAESPVESSPSATTAPSGAGELQTAASTPAEVPQALTFEQMVEARFLKLEAAVMQLPASMHAVMSDGSKEPEDFAKAVMAHVFAHI